VEILEILLIFLQVRYIAIILVASYQEHVILWEDQNDDGAVWQ